MRETGKKSIVTRAGAIVLSLVLAFGMVGCKDSLKLTEIHYDQQNEDVDYDNPTKVVYQDINATETTDQLPLVQSPDAPPEQQEEEKPEEDQNDEEQDTASDTQITLSGTGYNTTVKSGATSDAGKGNTTKTDNAGGSTSNTGKEDGDGGNTEDEDTDDGDDGKSGTPPTGSSGARSGGQVQNYDARGESVDPPTGIDYVAAVGEAATIVSMLAGEDEALLFTDSEWANRENVREVLGSKFNSDLASADRQLWTQDNTNSYSITDADLQKVIDYKSSDGKQVEAVVIMSGTTVITSEQAQTLLENGINVITLPNRKTASNIKAAVKNMGSILALGDNENTEAESLADEYCTFHDDVLTEASRYSKAETTETGSEPVTDVENKKYTVYVSDWVDGVSYTYDRAGLTMDTSAGVGVVKLGYVWSPLSYYLSIGGAINTGSQGRGTKAGDGANLTGTAILWQYSTNHLMARESDFTGMSGVSSWGYSDNSGNTYYGWTYLTSYDERYGVGTSNFKYVIVNSQHAKSQMESDRDSSSEDTLYKLYPLQNVSNSAGTVTYHWVGPLRSEAMGLTAYAVGGLTGEQNGQTDSLTGYDPDASYTVEVNPYGLFESWTDGTVESFLETAWIAQYYADGAGSPNDTIKDFYRTFYGYDLDAGGLSVSNILAGLEE